MNLRDSKLLITGATGSLGKQLVYECLQRGIRPIAMVRRESNTAYLDSHNIEKRTADIRNRPEIEAAMKGIDAVIHCVAWVNFRQDKLTQFTGINIIGALDTYRAAAKAGVKRFVQISSIAAVGGNPRTLGGESYPMNEDWIFNLEHLKIPYVMTKHAAEVELRKAAAEGGPELVIMNPSTIAAPSRTGDDRGKASKTFARRFLPDLPNVVNLVDIRDVAPAILTAVEKGRSGERYLLVGDNIPVRELILKVAGFLGRRPHLISLPTWFYMSAAHAAVAWNKLTGREKTSFYPDLVRLKEYDWAFSNAKARVELGFAPRSLESTLEDLLSNNFVGTYMKPVKR
jgi:dihydroflavonol-4-reductase